MKTIQQNFLSLSICSLLLAGCASVPAPKTPVVDASRPAPAAVPSVATSAPLPGTAPSGAALPADMAAFAHELAVKDGFNEEQLRAILGQAVYKPRIVAIMNRPGEAKPWYAYRAQLINHQVVGAGVRFMREHAAALARAEKTYQVPAETIAAILGIETRFGENRGSFRVLDSLATLAFHYPRREAYFRGELEQFLLMCRAERVDPASVKGSFAGAMGLPQFMPSSFLATAVDFDGDGRRDLNDADDAIGSVARYFHEHGWQHGQPVASPAKLSGARYGEIARQGIEPRYSLAELKGYGVEPSQTAPAGIRASLFTLDGRKGPEYWIGYPNFQVITQYNHSRLYAMAVYQLGQELKALTPRNP